MQEVTQDQSIRRIDEIHIESRKQNNIIKLIFKSYLLGIGTTIIETHIVAVVVEIAAKVDDPDRGLLILTGTSVVVVLINQKIGLEKASLLAPKSEIGKIVWNLRIRIRLTQAVKKSVVLQSLMLQVGSKKNKITALTKLDMLESRKTGIARQIRILKIKYLLEVQIITSPIRI